MLPPAPAQAAPRPEPPAVAAKPSRIHVEIHVSPPTAKLEIDETEVAGNPFAGTYLADTAVHHVRATAPGYASKLVTVGFDANVRLALGLERLPPPAVANVRPVARPTPPAKAPAQARLATTAPPPSLPAAAPSVAAEPKPAPMPSLTNEVNPAGGSKPHRAIDSRNPYDGQ